MKMVDKSALVAEIESKFQKYWKMGEESDALQDGNAKYWGGVLSCLNEVKTLINTIEVKEVDLEKEYKDFVEEDPVYNKLVNSIVGKAIAKHFFELGLRLQTETNIAFKYNIGESVREYKAQKGEEV